MWFNNKKDTGTPFFRQTPVVIPQADKNPKNSPVLVSPPPEEPPLPEGVQILTEPPPDDLRGLTKAVKNRKILEPTNKRIPDAVLRFPSMSLSLSALEDDTLRKKARSMNLNLSEFIRYALFDHKGPGTLLKRPHPEVSVTLTGNGQLTVREKAERSRIKKERNKATQKAKKETRERLLEALPADQHEAVLKALRVRL